VRRRFAGCQLEDPADRIVMPSLTSNGRNASAVHLRRDRLLRHPPRQHLPDRRRHEFRAGLALKDLRPWPRRLQGGSLAVELLRGLPHDFPDRGTPPSLTRRLDALLIEV